MALNRVHTSDKATESKVTVTVKQTPGKTNPVTGCQRLAFMARLGLKNFV